jgi:hypothetical protein
MDSPASVLGQLQGFGTMTLEVMAGAWCKRDEEQTSEERELGTQGGLLVRAQSGDGVRPWDAVGTRTAGHAGASASNKALTLGN